jgi:hypothetical protein
MHPGSTRVRSTRGRSISNASFAAPEDISSLIVACTMWVVFAW